MSYLAILSVRVGIHWSLGGLEMKYEEEKSKFPPDTHWGAAPAKWTQDRVFLTDLAGRASQRAPYQGLFDRP